MTDGQTDRPTDSGRTGKNNMSPDSCGGGGGGGGVALLPLFLNIAFKAYFITFWLFKMLCSSIALEFLKSRFQ